MEIEGEKFVIDWLHAPQFIVDGENEGAEAGNDVNCILYISKKNQNILYGKFIYGKALEQWNLQKNCVKW